MSILYTTRELQAIEKLALAELPIGTLMERAGKEAAELAMRLLPKKPEQSRILVLVGPGNNGGDALEMAAILAHKKYHVSVLQMSSRKEPSEELRLARKKAINTPIQWEDALSIQSTIKSLITREWDLVVDGIFGIGLKKPLSGNYYHLVEVVNTLPCPVLALDVPSGLDCDTGSIPGENGIAIKATDTLTFMGNKPGLYTHKGRDYAGNVHHVTLGIDECHFSSPERWLNQPYLFSSFLHRRPHDSHKGSYGQLAILGGAEGMAGAPVLAARAALHCGAGLTYAVYLKNPPEYDPVQPELMCRAAHRFDFSSCITVVGPGLGRSTAAKNAVQQALEIHHPLVIDADALNLVSENKVLQQLLEFRRTTSLITPHPLEAARLLETTTDRIQNDRLHSAHELASRFNAIVVLKGSGTVIASPDGKIAINPTGGPGLATAGTGDVLSGVCGALLAQGWPAWEAALASVWLHGSAADNLTARGNGPIGLTAGELIPEIRKILNSLVNEFNS